MSPSYLQTKHDIGILRSDASTKVGLMLAELDGKKAYRTSTERYLKNQYYAGAPDYAALDPQSELAIILDDWRAGMGTEVYDSTDTSRYYQSFGCDLRHNGRALLSNTPTAIALPSITAVSITNADFELNSDWTTGAGSAAQDGTKFLSGAKSWKQDTAGYIYQDLTWNANHKGHTFRFLCWVWASLASNARLAINDGDTTTYSDYHAGSSAWVQLAVSKTIGASATQLRIECHGGVAGSDSFVDDAEIWQPVAGTIQAMANFNDKLYFGINNELYKLNATGDGFTSLVIFPTAINSIEVFNELMFIGLADGIVIEDCEDAWTASPNCTSTLDTGDYKVGSGSAQMVSATALGVNSLWATEAITATNISSADGLDLWIKCSIATTAGHLEIHLDNTAACASPTETLAVPALVAGKWDRIHIDLAAKSTDTAIISVGLYQTTDIGVATVHIDNVELAYKTWYMTSGETFIQSTITNAYCNYLQTVRGTSPTLYLGHHPNEVRAATDPTNAGSWGAITYIDSANKKITELIEWQSLLYVMKEDRPYYIDGSGNVQGDTAPELETEESTTSGKNATVWHNKLYTQAGTQTLLESQTDGTNTFRSPANFITNDSNYTGSIFALRHDTFYLYAVIDNSAKVEVLAGRLETIGSTTSWVWHPLTDFTLTGCETCHVSTTFQKRLWISSTSSGNSLYYIPLPATYGNIESDTNKLFATNGYFVTPWLHGGFKGENKRWIKATATLGHAYDVDIYWELHYQKKGDSAWTDAGDFKGSATTRVATLYLPDDASSNSPISPMMRFKLVGKTDTTATTPVLLSLDIRSILRPPVRKFIECAVRVADGILDKQGNKLEGTNAAYIRTVLDEARDASDVFTFYDKFGTTKYGIMLPMDTESQMQIDFKGENPEFIYLIRIQEVALS